MEANDWTTLSLCYQELDAKSRMLSDLTVALQREERGRLAAEDQAAALRGHLQALEHELKVAQVKVPEAYITK